MEHVGPPDSKKVTTTNTDFMPLIEEGSGSQKATTNMSSDFMRCISEGEVNIKSALTRALSLPAAVISTLPSVPVLTPTGPLKRTWDLVIMVLILYSAIIVPLCVNRSEFPSTDAHILPDRALVRTDVLHSTLIFRRICFEAEAEGATWVFEASMSVLFMVDLCLSFNTGYFDNGIWELDRKKIAVKYLKGWFWIDAPSSVPVELIELFMDGGDTGSIAAFRVLRLARLMRLLRMLKMSEYIARLEEQLDVNLRMLRVVQLIGLMGYMSHMLGCGWFLMTSFADEDELTWIEVYEDGKAADGPISEQYLYSFFWALTTLVGAAGNVAKAGTDVEKVYQTCASVVRALFFAYVIGEIGTLLQALDRQAQLVAQKMDTVKEYLQVRAPRLAHISPASIETN